MIEIGKINSLLILKQVDFGLYLDGEEHGEILLPKKYQPADWELDSYIDVYIYYDSEDRLVATTLVPSAQVGEVGHMRVVDTNKIGAFLDWGIAKDLYVPFKEQRIPMQIGKSYSVYVYEDKSGRIAGSSKLHNFLAETADEDEFEPGEPVDLHIAQRTDLGYKAVIDGTHIGLIHNNEVFAPIEVGDEIDGYIDGIRDDGRINIRLQARGKTIGDELADRILAHLQTVGGISTITDKSPPDEIYTEYRVSKSNYKKALGKLYKAKLIKLEKDKITLL